MREEVRSSSGAAAEPPLAVARSSSPPHTPVARYGGGRASGPLFFVLDSLAFGAVASLGKRGFGARIGGDGVVFREEGGFYSAQRARVGLEVGFVEGMAQM